MSYLSIFDKAEKAAAENTRIEQGDYYGEDGLLVCGKCHTPKQVRIDILGEERTPFCDCKCEAEKTKAEQRKIRASGLEYEFYNASRELDDFALLRWLDCREYQISPMLIAERKKLLKRICFPCADMSAACFAYDDGANERVSAIMRNYVENFETMKANGKGLLLFGDVGRGKSFFACCVGNALIEQGIPVLFTDFERIERESSKVYGARQEYFDRLNNFPLLIIDDLGVERKSSYMSSIVYTVIEMRINAGLPVIVTTNLTSEELKNPDDINLQRIYSRLLGACIPIEVKGVDRRRVQLKADHSRYKDILGY